MGNKIVDYNTVKPLISEIGTHIEHVVKSVSKTLRNSDYQKGVVTVLIPSGLAGMYFLCTYQKKLDEKEALYKEKLQMHEAIIKELSKQTEMDNDRMERLLQYDNKLKEEIELLNSEIEDLKCRLVI